MERRERLLGLRADHGVDSPIQEMRVCEIAHLILRPGQLYRFSIDPECPGCVAYGADAYDVNPVRRLL
jgi:hypothetical protein